MKRWDAEKNEDVEVPEVDVFLNDLVAVCRKHGMSLGHEDRHGAFEVYRHISPDALEWLCAAHISEWR